ncbi:MAG: hypothetical protein ACRYFS_03430 [Janthinobacterium lividum]
MNLTQKILLGLTTLTILGLTPHSATAQTVVTAADSNVGVPGTVSGGALNGNLGGAGGNGLLVTVGAIATVSRFPAAP